MTFLRAAIPLYLLLEHDLRAQAAAPLPLLGEERNTGNINDLETLQNRPRGAYASFAL
jgi:hypothetical protein